MLSTDIIQFKMTNGDEIICQIVDWAEETEDDYIVKNAMCVVQKIINDQATKYMFKPWFTLVENSNQFVCIAKEHIVACCSPNNQLLGEYGRACREMGMRSRARPNSRETEKAWEEYTRAQMTDMDKMHDEIMSLIDDMERRSKLEKETKPIRDDDSDGGSNIIKFPGPDSVH